MFNFNTIASPKAGISLTTSSVLADECGEIIGSVMFFANEDMTLAYSEVLIPCGGKLSCSSVHQHDDKQTRGFDNDAIFDALGGITTIRR